MWIGCLNRDGKGKVAVEKDVDKEELRVHILRMS